MIYSLANPSRLAPISLGAPGARGRSSRRRLYRDARLRGHQLGSLGVSAGSNLGPWTLLGPATVSPSGGTASSALLSATSGASMGLMFGGPIGAGIGAIAGAIAGIWASHAARAKGAKTENAAVNEFLPAFDSSLKAIFAAANSGQLAASDAITACQQLLQIWWSNMAPYQTGPGRKDGSKGGAACGDGTLNPGGPCTGSPHGPKCDSSCTAGCCVGCQDLYPTILQAIQVFSNPNGGTITACNVSASGYGATARSSYTLTYTPPGAAAVGGLAADLGLGGSGLAGSSSSWLIWALLGVGAFYVVQKM